MIEAVGFQQRSLRRRSAVRFNIDGEPGQLEPLGKAPRHGGIILDNQNPH